MNEYIESDVLGELRVPISHHQGQNCVLKGVVIYGCVQIERDIQGRRKMAFIAFSAFGVVVYRRRCWESCVSHAKLQFCFFSEFCISTLRRKMTRIHSCCV
ncbi:hypothetical protein EJD97_014464 [Solanum chilense]|uniref:Uncharacterized protein n=1 Tax=Solanum chilense TaxID=4083 RepID=A0A6N2C7V0_SOLCI|nr:hypothetical protein EJD97_014464 [Solanum chilense]